MAYRVAVLGASGYTGGELLRLLALHPEVEVVAATSREYAGKPVHFVHFNLRGWYRGLRFTPFSVDAVLKSEADVVFSALPHGVGLEYTKTFYESGLTVVDLSADYRLRNPEAYKTWYGFEHPYPDLLEKAVYGLPELHREELRGARLIASPGCNATAAILALAPLAKERLVDLSRIIVDVKVGSSEGGSKPTRGSHHPERENAIRPYEPRGHRHAAEAEQELSRLAGSEVRVSLIPHAVSSIRGALASGHAWLLREVEEQTLLRLYAGFYRDSPFVRLVHGTPPGYPDPKYVAGSNYADVGFALEKRLGRVTGFAAIDNLVKGAAGQAVQAWNIAAGLPEDTGLRLPPLKPA
ncbi:N-acetyl-gamma-glutamyl-phosphate reductase [Pyrodictium occultum]|uniref:Putative [LysW]-L-2-aminoadipate/[LysW]-L-glutamate phosphate reductase n=1 Tax=Pyrodictium occultum TaxID=2309 RepID=A0A0V8RX29_PYROC|nr:N-acetyl-gamma-glutamyl-phosphate reductase [Pyrodictium occultum]KSW12593.1 N-acetyl-gamma-glutamyl-phosphate reductase [Pyrodictium occultum]